MHYRKHCSYDAHEKAIIEALDKLRRLTHQKLLVKCFEKVDSFFFLLFTHIELHFKVLASVQGINYNKNNKSI